MLMLDLLSADVPQTCASLLEFKVALLPIHAAMHLLMTLAVSQACISLLSGDNINSSTFGAQCGC